MGEPRNTGSSFGGQDGMNSSSAIMAEGGSSPHAPQPQCTTAAARVTVSWRVRIDVSHKGRPGPARDDGHGTPMPCAEPQDSSQCRGKPPQPAEDPLLNPTSPDHYTTIGMSEERLPPEMPDSVASTTRCSTDTQTNNVTTGSAGTIQRCCESRPRDQGLGYSIHKVIQQVETMSNDFVSKETTFDSPAGQFQLSTLATDSRLANDS